MRSLFLTGLCIWMMTACGPELKVEVKKMEETAHDLVSSNPDTAQMALERLYPQNSISQLEFLKTYLRPRSSFWDPQKDGAEADRLPSSFIEECFYPFMEGKLNLQGMRQDIAYVSGGEYHLYKDYFYFTLEMYNEYCCRVTYAFSSHLDSLHLIDAVELGLQGGDGNWYRHDFGSWTNDTLLHLLQTEEETLSESNVDATLKRDTFWIDISIDSEGLFYRNMLDSVSDEQRR